jgi:hypothetical protein
VTLKCPICMTPVQIPDREFTRNPTIRCPQGHVVRLKTDQIVPAVKQLVESHGFRYKPPR